jgi:hypothetical protein
MMALIPQAEECSTLPLCEQVIYWSSYFYLRVPSISIPDKANPQSTSHVLTINAVEYVREVET